MASAPTLFLIDGNNQMYRAYHAIRGLSGPDGRSTNAVYGFVTMLRKLIADHQPAYIGASFDLAGPTFRDALAADYKANRAAMPDDLAEQIPWVHEACEALGVPIVVQRGLRGRRRDRDAGAERGGRPGCRSAIVTGDKDFFQLVDDSASASSTRATRAPGSTRAAVQEKWGVAPSQVVDVLALMGDSIDNVKGVPGIGEKGAKDLIAHVGLARRAARARGRGAPEEVPRGAARPRRRRAAQPRAARDPHRRAAAASSSSAFRYRGASRERCYELFSQPRVPVAGDGVRADGGRRREGVPTAVTTLDGARRARRPISPARRRVAVHALTDGPSAIDGAGRGPRASRRPRAARGTCRCSRARSLGDGGVTLDAARSPRSRGVLEDPAVAEDRARPEVRAPCVLAPARRRARTASPSTRCSRATCSTPTRSGHSLEDTALEHLGLQGAHRGGRVRHAARRRATLGSLPVEATLDLRRRARRPGAGSSPTRSSPRSRAERLDERLPDARDAARARARRHRARRRPDRRPGARGAVAAHRGRAAGARRTHLRAGRPGVQHQLAEAARRDPVRQAAAAGAASGPARRARSSTAVEVLEELALTHDLPRLMLEWRALQKLKGTYIDALPQLVDPRHRPRAHLLQPGGRGDRAG